MTVLLPLPSTWHRGGLLEEHLIYMLRSNNGGMYPTGESFTTLGEMIEKELENTKPEKPLTNVFWTIFKCIDGDRNKPIDLEYYYIDLDGIDSSRSNEYILCLGGFLNIDPDVITVIFSGRGLQCFIKLDQKITAKDFKLKRTAFRTLNNKFQEYCKQKGLHLEVDTSVYESKRVLRYPNTINYKPDKSVQYAQTSILQKGDLNNFKISLYDLLKLADYNESIVESFNESFSIKKGKKYKNKKCIETMWNTPIKEGQPRHPIFIRLCVHEKGCGTSYEDCKIKIENLCRISGLDPKLRGYDQLKAVYKEENKYDFGCNDSFMQKYCTNVCYLHHENIEKRKIEKKEIQKVNNNFIEIYQEYGIVYNKNGFPVNNIDNVTKVFEMDKKFKSMFWFDDFHQKYFTNWIDGTIHEWNESDDLRLTLYFQRDLGFSALQDNILRKAVLNYANLNVRNEPCDWIKSLKWDGRKRIESFMFMALGAHDNIFVSSVSNNFWRAMIYRLFKPGCKFDYMAILEGEQGAKKSTALEKIAGKKWYSDCNEQIGTKDFLMVMRGKLISEISELNSFSKADINAVKRTLSCSVDRFRPPYGKDERDFPRRGIFVGTTNEHQYLKDSTGARRFWPIKVNSISLDYIEDHREQLFAEAYQEFLNGETCYEVPLGMAMIEQEYRREEDPWEERIIRYLLGKDQITTSEIALIALEIPIGSMHQGHKARISKILTKLGFIQRNSNSKRVYHRTSLDSHIDI